jgi:hypothetical protein
MPDVALLEIFKFYVDELEGYKDIKNHFDGWHSLVHVCQRWRSIVFSSPRRLSLQLFCMYGRSVKEMLNIWPELPITVAALGNPTAKDVVNAIAALQLTHRVSRISLWDVPGSVLDRFSESMQVPFPALTDLDLWWDKSDEVVPVLSNAFLGGSASHLRRLWLNGIIFRALPKLLLSAANLIFLYLQNIPQSGYISPEEMVACLSALTGLQRLYLGFRSPESRPFRTSRLAHPLTRTILPALVRFQFRGVTEYLEDLVARIDVPFLADFEITFFNQLIFHISQLPRLVCCADDVGVLHQADVVFSTDSVGMKLFQQTEKGLPGLGINISCRNLDWQLSSLAQVCNTMVPTLSTLECFSILEDEDLDWQDNIENTQWLELLQPFKAVKSWYLTTKFASCLAQFLQGLTVECVSEVLPALRDLFLEGLQPSGVPEALRKFVGARQLSGHPVVIHHWERERR